MYAQFLTPWTTCFGSAKESVEASAD